MEDLPWGDDTFDLVAGFNSFFIADDMGAALKEARRAARPGGSVALTVFGRPDHCDSTEMFGAVRRLVMGDEAPAPDGDDGPKLHDPGVLEEMARGAGLDPVEAEFLEFTETYPDLATLLRGSSRRPRCGGQYRRRGRRLCGTRSRRPLPPPCRRRDR